MSTEADLRGAIDHATPQLDDVPLGDRPRRAPTVGADGGGMMRTMPRGRRSAAWAVERVFELRSGRTRSKVHVRFAKPAPADVHFRCAFEIDGLRVLPSSRRTGVGQDSIDALHHAMKLAMAYLLTSNAYERGHLTWHGTFDLGLPVHDEVAPLIRRDLDAKAFVQRILFPPSIRESLEHPPLRELFERIQEQRRKNQKPPPVRT
jgi:hypothetical protein